MWLGDISQRVWCFVPSLLTVVSQVSLLYTMLEASASVFLSAQILVCVSANLTLVYALLSYSNVKHKDFNRILVCEFTV